MNNDPRLSAVPCSAYVIMHEALRRIATQHPINDEPLAEAHCKRAAAALKKVREMDTPNETGQP